MFAEVVPAAEDLATKQDLHGEVASVRSEIADLRAEMHKEFSSMKGWLLATMVPLWLGVYGGLVTMIVHLSQG